MSFKAGEWVVHCTHGLGQIVIIEKRSFGEENILYYQVKIGDLTIWVPENENLSKRLRAPTSQSEFDQLFMMLANPPEALPTDRRQRTQYLTEILQEGTAESLCKVIRDLSAIRRERTWSEYDKEIMRRVQKNLIGEWSFIFSIHPHDAEAKLQNILLQNAT